MKFLLVNNLREDTLMKSILTGLLLFTILYLIADIFVKDSSFGLFTNQIHQTLFGNEEEYLDPISKASFLEFWHMEIFFTMMVLFSLSAVFIRLCTYNRLNTILLNLLLVSALLSLVSLTLSFFVSSIFVNFYVVNFFIWHVLAFYMSVFSLWNLYYDPSL